MSTTEQSSHVSLPIPSERPLPPPSDNFQFMNDTFTLSQEGQTQGSYSQGYTGEFADIIYVQKSIVDVFRKDRS